VTIKRVIRFASSQYFQEYGAKVNMKTHWEHIYETKGPTKVSWYQEHAQLSLQYIRNTGIRKTDPIIDVGGGASTLVDDLIADGFQHITILDISASALELARQRLSAKSNAVTWIEADITQADLPYQFYAVWHDRAVFHFLTQAIDRQRYIDVVRHAVQPGGHVVVATFAPDGPDHCSGLEVMRYAPERLHNEFGASFELMDSTQETHHTPFGTEQKFIYCYCRKY
jgi:ubiquinone/menaquinone biosynthesis C-methylase UbiE